MQILFKSNVQIESMLPSLQKLQFPYYLLVFSLQFLLIGQSAIIVHKISMYMYIIERLQF